MSEHDDNEVTGAVEAIERMTDVIDGFETYAVFAAGRERHGTQYRLNLLWIHSFAALLVAPLLSATGRDGMTGPSFSFLRGIPGTPYSLSALLGIGGLILGMGCVFRAKRTEVTGLFFLMLFYVFLAVSFAVPPIRWLMHSGQVKPPMYSPVIYCHLAVIMGIHIWALIVRLNDEKRAKIAMDEVHARVRARRDDERGGAT